MIRFRTRFASTNAPESRKRGLLQDRWKRTRLVWQFYLRHNIDIVAVQEAGTYASQVDLEVGKLKSLWAQANSIVRGRRVGNGVIVNRIRFKSKQLQDLTVGDLHVAVVRVTHRRTGFSFIVFGVHRRTRRDDPTGEDRREMNKALRVFIGELERVGKAWVVIGDANEGEQWGIANLEAATVLGQVHVDHVVASHHFEPLGQKVVEKARLSDHDFLIADARVTP
jgi:hypothetical protein